MDHIEDIIIVTATHTYKLKNKINGILYDKKNDKPVLIFDNISIKEVVICDNILQTGLDVNEFYKLILEVEHN